MSIIYVYLEECDAVGEESILAKFNEQIDDALTEGGSVDGRCLIVNATDPGWNVEAELGLKQWLEKKNIELDIRYPQM